MATWCARGVNVAGAGEEPGSNGVGVHGGTGPVIDGVAGETAKLVRVRPGSHELEPLRHPDVAGVGLVQPIAQLGGQLDHPLRLVQPPAEQREAGSTCLGGVPMTGLAVAVEQREARLERRLEGR